MTCPARVKLPTVGNLQNIRYVKYRNKYVYFKHTIFRLRLGESSATLSAVRLVAATSIVEVRQRGEAKSHVSSKGGGCSSTTTASATDGPAVAVSTSVGLAILLGSCWRRVDKSEVVWLEMRVFIGDVGEFAALIAEWRIHRSDGEARGVLEALSSDLTFLSASIHKLTIKTEAI